MGAAQSSEYTGPVPTSAAAWALLTQWSSVWDIPRFAGQDVVMKREAAGPMLRLAASCATVLQPHIDACGDGEIASCPQGASRELLVAFLDRLPSGRVLAKLIDEPEKFVRALTKSCFQRSDGQWMDHLPEARLDEMIDLHCSALLKQAALLRSDPSSTLQAALGEATEQVQELLASQIQPGDLESVANRLLLADHLRRIAEEAKSLLTRKAEAESVAADGGDSTMQSESSESDPPEVLQDPALSRTKSQIAAALKVQTVRDHVDSAAVPVHDLARTVSLMSKRELPHSDEVDALHAEMEAVDQAKKRARNFGEDLVEDMLALDGLSNLSLEDRNVRKTSIASIESLLQDVDTAKVRLGTLHQTLQEKLVAAQAQAAANKEACDAPRPQEHDQVRSPRSPRIVAPQCFEAPLPSREDWERLRLPLRFSSRREPQGYGIVATITGIDTKDLTLELSQDSSKLVVRGLRVPSKEEAAKLQHKISKKIQRIARQTPEYFATLQSNLKKIAHDGYMELGQDSYGRFSETFQVPEDADVGRISASHRDGVLHISIPRRAVAYPGFEGRTASGRPGYRQSPRLMRERAPNLFGGFDDRFVW